MYRWVFLFWSSLSFFVSQIFIDQTAPLVGRLTGKAEACRNGDDPDCLDLTATEFNSFYVVQYWVGGVAALSSGFFLARYGVWTTSCTSGSLSFLGMLMFTLGPYLAASSSSYALMLVGRLIFALGIFTQVVLSHQIKSHWFLGKELALAFALYNVSSRLGSVCALTAMGAIVQQMGLQRTLWITLAMGVLAPVGAVLAGWTYKRHASASIDAAVYVDTNGIGHFGLRKVAQLGREFWTLSAMVFFFYGPLFTLIADYPKYLAERYQYDEASAGEITGVVSDIAFFAPLLGLLIDKIGWRDVLNSMATALFFTGLLLPATVRNLQPVAIPVLLGLSYAVLLVGLWCSIPLVTAPADTGVAFGVSLGLQALSSGILLLVTGVLLDQTALDIAKRWENFFIFLASIGGMAFLLSGLSLYYDRQNPLRPLRMKHAISFITADANSAVNESSLLLGLQEKDVQ
ncbi:hypothetical protein BV898_00585 [Hypsibius exemplaris]|uniref:Lysosomal dipeptide transporter MFSD1 n=1 Tax=Hypsibius exemplaris TaxID=2072580 RepID=A0A1W0XDV6_HYPEX|nr:hypothetical protein BV898_00585 [Hypsibius exemplaris]